jgi:NAD(P)-dependent dehydrogenase (short-subunit alcohol dehydrogenase family)
MLLAGKKVVVVGGSSGIGLATAELAKREGAEVIIASRNADKLNAAAAKLGVKAIQADVSSDDSVAALFRQCGTVDHVVITAAQLKTGPFKTVSMDDVRSTMDGKFWRLALRAADIPLAARSLVSGLSVRPRPAPRSSAPPMARSNRHPQPSAGAAPCASTASHPASSTRRFAPPCRKRAPRCWQSRGRAVDRRLVWRRYHKQILARPFVSPPDRSSSHGAGRRMMVRAMTAVNACIAAC